MKSETTVRDQVAVLVETANEKDRPQEAKERLIQAARILNWVLEEPTWDPMISPIKQYCRDK